ncbi:MAG: hypothetical protein Q4F74_04270 [Synergistaceae bacterium]|nr:hypothetical protein [Synergistaceae bacterium]
MDIKFSTLSAKDFKEVYRIFADSFYDSAYYRELFPDDAARLAEFDALVAPSFDYCLGNGGALGAVSDGKLLGFNLVVKFESGSSEEAERIFFDSYIAAGDKSVPLFREKFKGVLSRYGSAAYFYIGVVDARYRGMGVGGRLNAEALRRWGDLPVMAELTSPEIISVYKRLCRDREMSLEKISDHYHIMTIAPKREGEPTSERGMQNGRGL